MLDQLSSAADGEGSRKMIGIVAANRSWLENLIYRYSTPRLENGQGKWFSGQVSACQLPATSVLSEPLKLTTDVLRYPRHVLEQREKSSPNPLGVCVCVERDCGVVACGCGLVPWWAFFSSQEPKLRPIHH